MMRSLTFSLGAGLILLAASASGENEIFPNVHNEPITIRILSGKDGHALAHVHLIVSAGYNQRDLQLKMWHEEAFTDNQGSVRLSSAMGNLPFLQFRVTKTQLCLANPHSATFSVDRILRDGLTAPNGCGTATVESTPGVFTVFAKGKDSVPAPASPAPPVAAVTPTPATASATSPALVTAPAPETTPAPAPARNWRGHLPWLAPV